MWEKIKIYGKAVLGIATDCDTSYQFAQQKTEEHHDLNNTYNKELLSYAKNIRTESNDEKNWDQTHPLNAQEAIQEAEKCLNADIERYMNSDDIEQRAFGYQMKMDHYDDLYRSARTQEEKDMITKARELENIKVQQREQQIQNNQSNNENNNTERNERKPEDNKEKNDMSNEEIDSRIKALREQIAQLQKLKK